MINVLEIMEISLRRYKIHVSKLTNIGLKITSVIRQKGESQSECSKKTMHAKFSEKRTFFTTNIPPFAFPPPPTPPVPRCKHDSYCGTILLYLFKPDFMYFYTKLYIIYMHIYKGTSIIVFIML